MKKLLCWIAIITLTIVLAGYIYLLFITWSKIPLWRIAVGIICCALSMILFAILLLPLPSNIVLELLSAFKFELLQLALISILLSFVIITV